MHYTIITHVNSSTAVETHLKSLRHESVRSPVITVLLAAEAATEETQTATTCVGTMKVLRDQHTLSKPGPTRGNGSQQMRHNRQNRNII